MPGAFTFRYPSLCWTTFASW